MPPALKPHTILDIASRPGWAARMLTAKRWTFGNLAGHAMEPLWYGIVIAVFGALVLAASSFLGARLGHAAVHPHHANAPWSH